MGQKNFNAEFCHLRAAELRAVADIMISENKERLLRIAADYEQMADQIERLGLGNGPRSPNPATG